MGLAADLRNKKPMVVPGIYDPLGARMVSSAGFEVMFQTGYGTSATLFGMPDYGFVGAAETVDNARRICAAVSLPLIVDADTGYGNALSVYHLVQRLESAGACGMFLEDQRWPKRCGHMSGKEVIPQEEYVEKLGAALDARSSKDFVVIARTDAIATEGLDSAIQRGVDNQKNGADAIFVEGPRSMDDIKQIASSINAPLVLNMIEGGVTPIQSSDVFHSMGFNFILYPLSVLFSSAAAALGTLRYLRKNGTTTGHQHMLGFDQFNELVGLSDIQSIEKRYA